MVNVNNSDPTPSYQREPHEPGDLLKQSLTLLFQACVYIGLRKRVGTSGWGEV